MKVGTKVELLKTLPSNPGAIPGIQGKVVASMSTEQIVVEWDKPGLFKSAFSGESIKKLKVIEEAT